MSTKPQSQENLSKRIYICQFSEDTLLSHLKSLHGEECQWYFFHILEINYATFSSGIASFTYKVYNVPNKDNESLEEMFLSQFFLLNKFLTTRMPKLQWRQNHQTGQEMKISCLLDKQQYSNCKDWDHFHK